MSEKKVMTKLEKQLAGEKTSKASKTSGASKIRMSDINKDKRKSHRDAEDDKHPDITEEMIVAGMSAFGDRDHAADPTLLSKKIARTYRAMARAASLK